MSSTGDTSASGGTASGSSGATEQGKQAASAAASAGQDVARTAATGAQQVVGEARQEVANVTRTATDEVRRLASDVGGELRTQASTQGDRLAEGLRTIGQQLSSVGAGQPLDNGMVRDLAQQASDRMSVVADRLSTGGVEGALSDLGNFARRRPGAFLAGAAVAGFVAGRLMRGAQAEPAPSVSGPQALGASTSATATPRMTPAVGEPTDVTPIEADPASGPVGVIGAR